jgi:hypothetical protein
MRDMEVLFINGYKVNMDSTVNDDIIVNIFKYDGELIYHKIYMHIIDNDEYIINDIYRIINGGREHRMTNILYEVVKKFRGD